MRSMLFVALFALGVSSASSADDVVHPSFSRGMKFSEQTGETLYAAICQDCHMQLGQGAVGAGHYPALAANAKLEVAGYPVSIVLHGLDGMPPVGRMLTDAQVADVVNYVRTHFGNSYADTVTPSDVAASR